MVTTPTRAPSTRLSRRTSSRSVNNSISEGGGDTPSTSSSNPPPPPPPVAMDTEEEEETIPEGTAEEETPTTSSEAQEKVVEEEKMEEEGPSSSTAPAPASPPPLRQLDEEEELIAYAVSMLLTEARKVRDKVAASCEKIKEEGRDYAEAWEAKMKPMIIEQVQKTEKNMALKPLEQLLQDPKHAVIIPPKMTPIREVEVLEQPGPSSSSSNKAMQPIEVKIEDGDGSAAPTTSVLPSTGGGGESNVERAAKREAQVVARINELRKAGLWSNSRLPKCVEPERNKTHWDYLLEEMKWLAVDFKAETANKKKTAKFLAHTIAKLHRDKQIEVARAAEREIKEKKKLCAGIAKMVRGFWKDIDTFVDLKAKEIREVRLQKAKNENLMHMLGHVSEISNVVGEGLVASKTPSIADDKEFEAPGTDSEEEDDEQTIANAEKRVKKDDVKKEVDALQNEANADQDDVILSLPMEYLKSVYGLTEEDVEVMRRNKREADEQKKRPKVVELPDEEEVEDEKMDVDEDPKPSDEPSTSTATTTTTKPSKPEQSQDPGAEDGNGDGRGVLKNVDYQKLNSNDSDERQQELANIAEEALKFMPSGYTLETTHVKTPVPFLIRGTLREYQMVGLDWMVTLYEKNLNGILADEMGLGKTIQTISLIAHLACKESIWGPHLIVVPTSVILNWEMEFKKWCPALKILTYFGTAKERAEKRKGWMKPNCFHVCITSYKTVTQDIRSFKQRAWQYLILDEAQNIKNWKSQRWQALLNVRARRRLLLTGTPLQNSLMELWSLLHFLMPTIFSSHDDFKDWFSNPLTGMMEGNKEMDAPLISRLHNVLRPFILRRLKREVEKQLPEKTEHVVKCSLSKRQRYLYDDFMSRRSTKDNLKSGNMMSVLNIVMQLRKCCNHPNLFEPRPVLAPFVVPRMEVVVPACLIGIQERDSSTDIPEIFNLQKTGYQPQSSTISSQKKPLIVELEAMQQNILQEQRVPEVEGFRFNRTTFVAKNPPRVGEESEDEGGNPRVNGSGSAPGPSNGTIITTPKINGNSSASTPRPPQTSAIRSKTVLNTTPLTINTAHSGFHFNMANQGKNRLDEAARMSPPLKRSKMTGEPVNWADYVPQHVVEKMEESRVNQLEIMRRRFGMMRAPIVPLEMVALIRDEIMSKFPRLVTESDDKIQETLMDHVELLVQRFGMYVEPVLTDAWQCRPTSSGLPYYLRQDHLKFEKDSRALLLESSNRIDTQMTIARGLQFPELRLIEYDCGKLQTLAILLRTLYLMKHRCLIFTQMSKMLDVLQTFLSHHGYQYFRLDGTTGVEQRQAMMERFNADPKIFCFILSTRSGGVGVNLTGADTVIFYDSDWNPTMDAQAQDRCHRIGQTRNVSIYRLISERTIEENILRKAQQKRRLGELAIDEAGFTPEFFKQSDNIRDLFDGENVDIAAPREEFKSDADMEKAMAKCEDEADVNAAKIANAEARLDSVEFRERDEQEEEANEKFKELLDTMRPIERYAVLLLETEYKPDFEEKCKEAEAQIHQKREEWDKTLNGPLLDDDPNGDAIFGADDYYPNGVEEVRTKPKVPKKPKFTPRARSPSKRKSTAPSLTPYISIAPHALASSPPGSPVRRRPASSSSSSVKPRRSITVGGGSGVGRGRPRKSMVKKVEESEDEEEEEEEIKEESSEDDSDVEEDDDEKDVDYKRPRGRPPLKRKRVAFKDSPKTSSEQPKRQRLAPNTPRAPPPAPPQPAPSRLVVDPPSPDSSSGPLSPASLTASLPAQGPLTLTSPSRPPVQQRVMAQRPVIQRSMAPPRPLGVTHTATPRPPRMIFNPPQQQQQAPRTMVPVRVVRAIGPPGGAPRPPVTLGRGGIHTMSRLPVRVQTMPIRAAGGANQVPRQFVIPSGSAGIQRPRIISTPGTFIRPGPSPTKVMYPVRIVPRPGGATLPSTSSASPSTLERPGFGIYEKPRIQLGSRRSRGDSLQNSDGAGPSSNPPPAPPQA